MEAETDQYCQMPEQGAQLVLRRDLAEYLRSRHPWFRWCYLAGALTVSSKRLSRAVRRRERLPAWVLVALCEILDVPRYEELVDHYWLRTFCPQLHAARTRIITPRPYEKPDRVPES